MTTQPRQPCEFREGTWLDFREDVQKSDPELFRLLEAIEPNKKYKLIKAKYLYGEKITDFGTICVPNKDGKLVRLDDRSVAPELYEKLSYCPTPLILQLTNASEVFVELEERIVPLNVFSPGDLYGLYEILVPFTGCPAVPCWSITSGGRSVFLAAKIADSIGHNNLRTEFKNVPRQPPKRILDQWQTIKAIANSETLSNPWSSEILIFTRDWFNKERKDDINWLNLYIYLYKKAWLQSRSNRVQVEYSIMWESFAKAVCKRNLKPNSYIVDTTKHLLLLTTGTTPGFSVADPTDEKLLPIKLVENAYKNVYGLNQIAAIIMQPQILAAGSNSKPIYYSMAYATLLHGTPSIRKTSNILSEVREVKTLMLTLESVLQSRNEKIYETIKNIKLEYFHSDDDYFGDIQNSQIIAETDSLIASALDSRFKNQKFPAYGPFFRGCIRISRYK
jgi:hypothetical protein